MLSKKGSVFVGHYPCLDFANTALIAGRRRPDPLQDFNALVAWLHEANLIDAAEVRLALEKWSTGRQAQQSYARAVLFRMRLVEMVEKLVASGTVPQASVEAINEQLRNQVGHVELARTKAGFPQRFRREIQDSRQLLVPLAQSAADLLSHGDLSLVKRCANPACALYFYDTSKNHTRRWCSMELCGSRMKMAAYYRRQKLTGHGSAPTATGSRR